MPNLGIFVAVLLIIAAVFLGAAGLYLRWGGALLEELRAAEGPTALERLRSLVLIRLGRLCRRRIPRGYLGELRRALVRAGEPARIEPEEVVGLQILAAFAFAAVGTIIGLSLGAVVPGAAGGTLVGALYPLLWLRDKTKRRLLAVSRALPFTLDLLTLSVEAGLDFTAALSSVLEKGKPGPLRDELALVLKELRVGRTREQALLEMIPRIRLPAVSAFVTALVQADRMGTSLGKVLRIQATQLRSDRSQRAEKLAGEAPVKMLFPLIACIFPTVFLVLFGPIVFAMAFGGIGG